MERISRARTQFIRRNQELRNEERVELNIDTRMLGALASLIGATQNPLVYWRTKKCHYSDKNIRAAEIRRIAETMRE